MPSYHSTSSTYDRDHIDGDAASLKSEKLGKMPTSNNFLLPCLFLELAMLASLAVFAYYLRFTEVFDVFRRYFSCSDPELSYPYTEYPTADADVTEKVTIYVDKYELYIISALLPPCLFILGEIIYKFCGPPSHKVVSTLSKSFKIPLFVRRMFRFIGVFWLGYLITSILTDSIKLLSGTPRPYLLNHPNFTASVEHYPANSNEWCILSSDITLTASLRDAIMSFPSFYATISAYAATFAICYVQVILDFHGNYFLRPVISACFAGMALMAGYTRWMLYYSAWEDILVGYIFGIAIALYTCFGILSGFKEHAKPESPVHYGGALPYGQNAMEARPGFFRFLPRIRTHLTGPRRNDPYHGSVYENNHAADQQTTLSSNPGYQQSTAFNQPNSDFQTDLHNTVQNFGSSQYGL